MQDRSELISPGVPSLETLQNEALRQILALNQPEENLRNYTTNVTELIQRYNAKKSYWGYAAHWYGEQAWWFKIVVSLVFAGITIVLSVPPIIFSIILSLVISFLLMNHNQLTQERDQLIGDDLNAQNTSVENSVHLLNTTKAGLQETLRVLCNMYLNMTEDNINLRDNLKEAERNLHEYQKNAVILNKNIEILKTSEVALMTQLGTLSQKFTEYQTMINSSALSFVKSGEEVSQTTTSFQRDGKEFSEIINHLRNNVSFLSSSLDVKGSPDSNNGDTTLNSSLIEETALNQKKAQAVLASYNPDKASAQVSALELQMTPPRNGRTPNNC